MIRIFIFLCKKYDPIQARLWLCFIDDPEKHPFHNSLYSEEYKMTFAEYKALSYTRQHLDCSVIDHTLKIYAGLSDQDLQQLDSMTKLKLHLSIQKTIDKMLAESLPNWS